VKKEPTGQFLLLYQRGLGVLCGPRIHAFNPAKLVWRAPAD